VVFCHNDQLGDLIPALVEDDRGDDDAMLVADMFVRLRPKFHRAALCVWIKPSPPPHRNKHYLADMEPYIHAWNRGYAPVGDHHDMHRWITAPSMPSKVFGHPTVKPLPIMDKIMRNMAGKTVCDPFCGTGSTGVAAIRAGKVFTGIEHNPKHFQTALERIQQAYAEGRPLMSPRWQPNIGSKPERTREIAALEAAQAPDAAYRINRVFVRLKWARARRKLAGRNRAPAHHQMDADRQRLRYR
jgi:hypothetical protein